MVVQDTPEEARTSGEPVAWDIEQVIYQFNHQCFDFQFAWQKGLGQNIEPQIAPQCIHQYLSILVKEVLKGVA